VFAPVLRLMSAAVFLLAQAAAEGRWEMVFFHDVDDGSFSIHELGFSTPEKGVALGTLREKNKVKPVALITQDGGLNWKFVPLKEDGLSLFFLDASLGWMATSEGIWKTNDGGLTFQKLAKRKGVARIHFLDPRHGFAVGVPKKVWETVDGGENWQEVPAARQPKSDPDRSIYTWIDFVSPTSGSITGWHEPYRPRMSVLPPWIDPESAARRRQYPSLSLALFTEDGGKSWTASTTSMFGRITRVRMLPGGMGYALVEYHDQFDYPSEVYEIHPPDISRSVYRAKDRAVTDLLVLRSGGAVLAAVEPVSAIRNLPVPGKLHILMQDRAAAPGTRNPVVPDAKTPAVGSLWKELPVDYRAVANRAVLATAGKAMFVATDTGMILRYIPD
jgi:hypothetical protein